MPFEDDSTKLPPPPFEFEWQVSNWCRLPREARESFVEELVCLMGKLATEKELDDKQASGDAPAP